MKNLLTDAFTFRTASLDSEGLLAVLAGHDEKEEEEVPHACLFILKNGEIQDQVLAEWSSGHLCNVGPGNFFVFGEFGDYLHYRDGDFTKGNLFLELSTDRVGVLRSGISKQGVVYWVGMSGLCFQFRPELQSGGAWDTGLPSDVDLEGLVSLPDESWISYGWKGNVFRWSDKQWNPIDVPTNVILTCGCTAEDGTVFLGGQNGILIRGKGENWELIEAESGPEEDIWGLYWFQEQLFVSTYLNIYRFNDGNFAPETFSGEIPESFYHMAHNQREMYSVGPKDLFHFDGKTWNPILLPNPL
jgi:hypothetical protein